MSAILFVCTGNVCRSPMAAGLLRKRLLREGLQGQYKVASAGVWALDGQPASEHAVAAMAERDIDISDHIAHTIAAEDVTEADVVLVMTREQDLLIRSTWPQYGWKVFRLSDLGGKGRDIQDPYSGSLAEYRACANLLAEQIDRGFARILALA